MANRILIGKHQTYGYGMFVSKPNTDVTAANNFDNLMFTSAITDSSTGIVSMNGECLNIAQKGHIDVTIASGNWNATSSDITYSRASFNDGSVDRTPYIISSVGAVTGTTPATQWSTSYLKVRSSSSSDKRFSYQGYRIKVSPFSANTTGSFFFNVGRNALYNGSNNNASSQVTIRCFYAITFLTLR